MDPATVKKQFEELIASTGTPLASLTPHAGLELMLRFYAANPVGELVCYWAPVTRYGPQELGFTFSHWFKSDDSAECEDCYLSLLFKIGPATVVGEPAYADMSTCRSQNELDACRARVHALRAFEAWGRSPAAAVAIECQDIMSWVCALFDCWGARDPSRPIVSMTEDEWLHSDDVGLMLRWLRQEWRGDEAELNRLIQHYLFTCVRRIWRLLPAEAIREWFEVAERNSRGTATQEELAHAEWNGEAAVYMIDLDPEPDETIARWCDEVAGIPREELEAMIHSPHPEKDLSPRRLLTHAAYFAHDSMFYVGWTLKEGIEKYRLFLPTPLLREFVGNPFRNPSRSSPA